jgi:hypothetical protein
MTSLAQQCDKIMNSDDSFVRYTVVGETGTGKSALLQKVIQRCRDDDLLALHVTAPEFDTGKDPVQADFDACATLISEFIAGIKAFAEQRPDSTAATSAATNALGRARNPNMWYHLTVNATAKISAFRLSKSTIVGNQIIVNGEPIDRSTMLSTIQHMTEEALSGLADEYKVVVLVDDVDRLDGTSVQGWLRGLLRRLPTYRTVSFRRPGMDARVQDRDDAEGTITLLNMCAEEVRAYATEQGLVMTDEDARGLFAVTRGHPFAVATWCRLLLNGGAPRSGSLEDLFRSGVYDEGFTRLLECVRAAVDQIAADVLGYQVPLFGLLTIAEWVTEGLIAELRGNGGEKPPKPKVHRIYQLLAQRQLVSYIDDAIEEGVSLPRATREVAWRQLKTHDPVGFRALQSSAERYERVRVDLERELLPREEEKEPFAAWTRFEQITWTRSVETWINHAQWLGHIEFQATKPTLVKLYLDAFWWWDDYLRSKATSDIESWLRRVSSQQKDTEWMNLLEKFSGNWTSSWDEAELRADPAKWKSVRRAVTGLLGTFSLEFDHVPPDMTLRRIYILLCIFYGKARWYAGNGSREDAEAADEWLSAAYRACQKQPRDKVRNPNGWIGSWSRLRQAEIWAALDRERAIGYLVGLDQTAIEDEDDDLRVGVTMLIGDLWWNSGDPARALDVYSRAALLSYTYNGKQEKKRQAPNLYTKSLYASTIRRAQEKISRAEQDGDPNVLDEIDTALAAVRELFRPYWDAVERRPDRPAEQDRFELPVPPPWPGDILEINSQYFSDLEDVLDERQITILKPIDPPPAGTPSERKSQ